MLWYKAWLETRWRFLIGLGVLVCSAAGTVFLYPKVRQLMPLVPSVDAGGEIGRQIRETAALMRDYRGYIWAQWFRQNLVQLWTLFAVLLGAGGLLAPGSAGALFTLSMPASRTRLLGVRAAAGLGELLALALVPSLAVSAFSPAVGEVYSVEAAVVHASCLFVAGTVFFSLTLLLSTIFSDPWRPLLIALAAAVALATGQHVFPVLARFGVFHAMTAEPYFRRGELPWGGLLLSAAASAAMLYTAAIHLAHRDF
jgi:hypothetical protein